MQKHNYEGLLSTEKYHKQLKNVISKLKNKKVILYGAGELYDAVIREKEIYNNIDIRGVSDNKFETSNVSEYNGLNAIKPSKLMDCDADSILLTTAFPKKIINILKKNTYKHIKDIIPLVSDICPLFKYDITFIKNENEKIYYHLNEYNIDVVADEYYGIIEEVFFWQIYNIKNKFKFKDYVLYDIGMNRAYTDIYFALDDRCKKCYGFEPFKATYNFALENIALNPELGSKIETFNFGLSDKNYNADVYFLPHRDGISSVNYDFIKNYAPEELNKLQKETVSLKNSSEIMEELLKTPSTHKILKLDAEGAEYQVLPNLYENKLLAKFNVIVGDMHVLNEKSDALALFDYFIKSGFKKYEMNEHEKTIDYIFYKDIETV